MELIKAEMIQQLTFSDGKKQVKRNANRFPESFMFQLTEKEWNGLQSQIVTTKNLGKKWFALLRLDSLVNDKLNKSKSMT